MPAFVDITGRTFGRLTVVARQGDDGHGHIAWACSCVCGGTIVATGMALKKGTTSSCGCLRKESARRNGVLSHGPVKHGGTIAHRSEYMIWKSMVRRATGKGTAEDRELYFGVTVCNRWRTSFPDFLSDMGPRPFPGASLDRHPNKGGGYEPGNVRWATPAEQANNRRPRRRAAIVKASRDEFRNGARP